MMTISFGTDGWRGKVGDAFTDANLATVAQATCDYLNSFAGPNSFVVIGYDRRFRSEDFAMQVAEIFSSNGFNVLLSTQDVSTPVVSYVTHRFKAAIGICLTASHNPPEYNGYKLKENFGGSALSSTIEQIVPFLGRYPVKKGSTKNITRIDFTTEYFANFRAMFDIGAMENHFNSTPIHLNYMHGSSAGYIGEVLKGAYLPLYEYNLNKDTLFGGLNPEPIPANLVDFISCIASGLGFAFDGDGDRICAATPDRNYVSSSQIMAILIPYLAQKHSASKIVQTVSCSRLVEAVAKSHGLQVDTTKIGFKYIAAEMIADRSVLLGGEESGGIGFYGYLPERDGIANCLLTLEALASRNLTLLQAVQELEENYGSSIQNRTDLKLTNLSDGLRLKIQSLIEAPEKLLPSVARVDSTDGVKLIQENGDWLMLRLSGTEPVIRLYAESDNTQTAAALIKKAKWYVLE